jgi:Rrf2 family protein
LIDYREKINRIFDASVSERRDEKERRRAGAVATRAWAVAGRAGDVQRLSFGEAELLTKKGKYGLKAMVHLAGAEFGRPVPVLEIAEQQRIPKKFLDAILCELRNGGFVHSKMGKGGGYCLARPAKEIVVGDLVRAIDGPLAPVPCASKTRYRRCDDCVDETTCAVRLVMQNAQQALSEVLDNCSLEQMRALAAPVLCFDI